MTDEVMERLNITDWESVGPEKIYHYFLGRYKLLHGQDYVTDKAKDMAIVRAYCKRMGTYAGPIIKRLFDEHRGRWNGSLQGTAFMSAGSRWISDILYGEIIESEQKEREAEQRQMTRGRVTSAKEFLEMF